MSSGTLSARPRPEKAEAEQAPEPVTITGAVKGQNLQDQFLPATQEQGSGDDVPGKGRQAAGDYHLV